MSLPNKKGNFVIHAFKQSPARDPDLANRSWDKLEKAIDEIFQENAGNLSFEELYRTGYNMVLHKHGEYLYQQVAVVLQKRSEELLERAVHTPDEMFLPALKKLWEDYKRGLGMVRDILMYMDRTFVKQNNRKAVYDVGVAVFGEHCLRSARVKDRMRELLLGLVHAERCGEKVDRDLIRGMTHMLHEIGKDVYAEDFEGPYVEASRQFYAVESEGFLQANSCPDYLRKAEARLAEEAERVAACLPSDYGGGEGSIRQVIEHELIGRHKEALVDKEGSGLARLLDDNKVEDLRRMYDMFARVKGGAELLEDRVAAYCGQKGRDIVQSPENLADHGQYVARLLDLKELHDRLVRDAFRGEKGFVNKVNRAFVDFVNLCPRSPEFISLAMDSYLRGAKAGKQADARAASEEQLEGQLEKCLQLFRFVSEKDMFEKYYKGHLARRLLNDRSQSDDMERKVIQLLKTECGYQFTAKLEGMFKDMNTSKDIQERFSQHRASAADAEDGGGGGGVELQIKVLTTGYWPTQPTAQCRLPPEVERVCGAFRRFYLAQHNGRQLSWQLNMGSADVKARYDKVYQINMPTYHMVVLLLFADRGAAALTCEEIERASGIPGPELKRTLQSLALTQFKLLTKEPKGKEVEPTDRFAYNAAFAYKMIKFKLSVVSAAKETNEEMQASRAKINEDRNPQIDAAIVRVMKARRSMEHNLLIAEVTKQLQGRFNPNPMVIKKRLEGLIDREFLQRSKTNMKIYEYLA